MSAGNEGAMFGTGFGGRYAGGGLCRQFSFFCSVLEL